MHKNLVPALLFLAGVATAAPARPADAAEKHDLVCGKIEPSTIFLPTTVYVTTTIGSSQSTETPAEKLFQTIITIVPAPEPTALGPHAPISVSPTARVTPKPTVHLSSGLRWGNYTQWANATANRTKPMGTATGGNSIADGSAIIGTQTQAPVKPNRSVPARNVLYFTNWGIYNANCQPQDVPADKVTHLLYAFGDITPNGTVISSDAYADVEKRYKGDSLSKRGSNAHGVVNQLYGLKKKNRGLKTLFSIGGFTYSQEGKFSRFAGSEAGRKNFATSAVKFMADWGMDGLDIDWEYPQDAAEAQAFVDLLRETRLALDRYAAENGQQYRYLLTVAASAGPQHYRILNLKAMDQYVDAWHLMSYDYAGGWDKTTGHQSNIKADTSAMASTKFDTDQAVTEYIRAGIAGDKIVVGLPLYGRSFGNTDGLGKSFQGAGKDATQEGVILYRDLPLPGAVVKLDEKLGSAWSYDPNSRELVSYDNVDSAKLKARYVRSKRLGGAVFWEASGDKKGEESLVRTMAGSFGALDDSENMLDYPKSKYDNIRDGVYL